jgi:hypothetical protein
MSTGDFTMSRKAKNGNEQMDAEIVRCFIDNFGREATTSQERFETASQWCMGNYGYPIQIATEKGLLPIALIIACLIDVEHPLLVSPGRGVMYSSTACEVIIFQAMLQKTPLDIPVKYSVHKKAVERIEQP